MPASAVEASTTSYFYLLLVFLYASKLYHGTNHQLTLVTSTEKKKFNRSTSWAKPFKSLYLLQGEMTDNPPSPRQWGMLEDDLLAVQCPMPGQQGAPCFRGKEISEFLRNWERMANQYRLCHEYGGYRYSRPGKMNTTIVFESWITIQD